MTPEAVLVELLDRIGAHHGGAVIVTAQELSTWPGAAVGAIKSQGLLTKARPATSAVCAGCERECVMPVHVLTDTAPRGPEAFIVCDKRSDINRVPVPVARLEQWQASGDSVASVLAGLLGLHRSGSGTDAARWEVGMLKGAKHSSHLVLIADGKLTLSLAGHSVPVADVLALEGNAFQVDRRTLNR
ncbi:MAG: hypothetical protein RBU21_17140, partial [FCB group bacterium]|nr:hypothetical protein [FCB group bacterium]